jgi:hypothetical protein
MKKVIIYLSVDKKNVQVIQPTDKFQGDWKGLVETVTGGNYYSYIVV